MANWNSSELQTPEAFKTIQKNAQNAINNLDILMKIVKSGADVAKLFLLLTNPAGLIIKIAANEIIKLCNDFKEIGVFYLFINPNDEGYGGYFILGLEDGTKTFPTKFANALPTPARFISLKYQNGFSTNVSYASSNSTFIVQSNAEISLSEDTADGETYELTYTDTSWPTTNASSYWFLNNVENSPVIDGEDNIIIFKTTSESTNFKVHFTIRAQKVHSQMDVYTGGAGTSTAASVLNTIDGWGGAFETGTGNYKDGYFYVSVYNNTDSDRDDQVVVFSDQNNASSTTLDFNGNAFKHRDDPDDPDTEISILNEEALTNAYSNGDFTLLTSI